MLTGTLAIMKKTRPSAAARFVDLPLPCFAESRQGI